MLPRVLEPIADDPGVEAEIYREMDHLAVNRRFISDLLDGGSTGPHVIDFGCGPAFIPILLCQFIDEHSGQGGMSTLPEPDLLRVMGIDSCINMLEMAKFELEMAGEVERIQLQQIDLTDPEGLQEEIADTVICNTVLHHLAEPATALRLAMRCLKSGGRLFVRDLYRPETETEIEELVREHTGTAEGIDELGSDVLSPAQLLRQSLHAALTLQEIRALLKLIGIDPSSVRMTSDRHWTIDCRKT